MWSKADWKSTYFTEAQAQKVGAQFAAKVGRVNVADVAACLRQRARRDAGRRRRSVTEPTAGGTIGPIVNGTTLTSRRPGVRHGHVNDVELISDVGRDEFNGGVYSDTPGLPVVVADTAAQYKQLVQEQFGRLAPTVERLYPLSQYQSPYDAYRTIMADSASVCPMVQTNAKLCEVHPAYVRITTQAAAGEADAAPRRAATADEWLCTSRPCSWTRARRHCRISCWRSGRTSPAPVTRPRPHASVARYSGAQHPVMLLLAAEHQHLWMLEAFISAAQLRLLWTR